MLRAPLLLLLYSSGNQEQGKQSATGWSLPTVIPGLLLAREGKADGSFSLLGTPGPVVIYCP